jgi:four helix bundle protein
MKSHRDLKVWNLGLDLTVAIYALTADFPVTGPYGLTSQLRRAAVSTASNIAEGSARVTRRDFRQFILIARGGNCELETQLAIARRLQFGLAEKLTQAQQLADQVGRMLSGLANYLARPQTPPTSK